MPWNDSGKLNGFLAHTQVNEEVEHDVIKLLLIKLLILPDNLKLLLIDWIMSVKTKRITFIYNGTEYDATAYSDKHPGGRPFIENMNA